MRISGIAIGVIFLANQAAAQNSGCIPEVQERLQSGAQQGAESEYEFNRPMEALAISDRSCLEAILDFNISFDFPDVAGMLDDAIKRGCDHVNETVAGSINQGIGLGIDDYSFSINPVIGPVGDPFGTPGIFPPPVDEEDISDALNGLL